jgi:uncharacterized protein (DUF885 family)
MTVGILWLVNTWVQPGAGHHPRASRFRRSPLGQKPSKRFRFHCCSSTGLKPRVNQTPWNRVWRTVVAFLAVSLAGASSAVQTQDAEYEAVAEEYVKTYLAAHPLQGTALGLHEYDGKITDYSRLALDAELSRLRRFDDRLAKFDPSKLSERQSIDLRILQAAVKRDLFEMQDMSIFERNPMVYARAGDVNVYIKRNFAPLEDRVRSLVAIESQIPNVLIAARTNLDEKLPKPFVELAIQIARGSADFLRKDLVAAVSGLKDEQLRVAFQAANRKAANALSDYATWLERDKLPKATLDFALGEEKFRRFLAQTELVDLPPQKILQIGMIQLKTEQDAFAEAAKKIDPNKPATEVFKQVQSEHPAADKLISDISKDLDKLRKYVVNRHLVGIPSEVRAKVKETPQYLRATSFASMDTPGPFEKRATEAYYYVTPTEENWPDKEKEEWLTAFNYYTSDVTSIHEVYPGHYVQFLHLNASPASKVEKIFGSYAFIEGWAHYCEKMMIDEGFGSAASSTPSEDDAKRAAKYRMAQADEALLRLCRLCVSIKVHTQNMSIDEATKFFRDNCYYEEKPARQEAMRATFDPGYLNYTLGKLQILKLRDDYKAQQGDEFSLQKFHNELLSHGMPPIRLLREIMLKDPTKWDQVL